MYTVCMGIVNNMKRVKAKRVMGLDVSTHSLAYAIMEGETPIACGEITFNGSNAFERLKDAKAKVKALVEAGILIADFIAVESAIMVRNVQTAIKLAYIFGAVIGELMAFNPQVHEVAPISWQSGIGNPNLKKHEKEAIMAEFPGKSKSWYQNKFREFRKQRTLKIARKYFDIPGDSDNVGDAVGIALFCQTLTR